MSRHFVTGIQIYTLLLLVSLVSITTSLSLEDLNAEMQKIKENNKELGSKIRRLQQSEVSVKRTLAAKVAQLQKLELKVQHLETKLTTQQQDCQTSRDAIHSAVNETASLVAKHARRGKVMFRTCRELYRSDRSLTSGMYWIDPDGLGFEDPIHVHCDMETGKTSIFHDSENATNIGDCTAPGCYSKQVQYSAPMRQMEALAALSRECHQSIKYDCKSAPFEIDGVAQSWWHDRNGVAQFFWSGNNGDNDHRTRGWLPFSRENDDGDIHTCQCGIDQNCVTPRLLCNCDSNFSHLLSDKGVITDKRYLPITRLNFGRAHLQNSSGVHTLGRFECTGQARINEVPSSCYDLWKIGHTLNGIYSVVGSDFYVETVYCDFAKLPNEPGFQVPLGYSDVKSSPVYFHVQKNVPHHEVGILPFEEIKLNIGRAMNASSGIFTAPRNGIYSFTVIWLGFAFMWPFPTSSYRIEIVLNHVVVEDNHANQGNSSYLSTSLHSILELKEGDQVWVVIFSYQNGIELNYGSNYYVRFSGHLLQEKLASVHSIPSYQ